MSGVGIGGWGHIEGGGILGGGGHFGSGESLKGDHQPVSQATTQTTKPEPCRQ